MAVYIEAAQRAEIQRMADAEGTTASPVYPAALEDGWPELRKALQHGWYSGVPAADGESVVGAAAP